MNLKLCFKPICKQIFCTLIQKVFYAGESLSELFFFFFDSSFTQLTVHCNFQGVIITPLVGLI